MQTLTDAANSGQVQSFGYDWLDRLTTRPRNAAGIGQYSHTYAYNAIGNITSYNGNTYTYGTKPHAVTGAFGNAYGYDAVGNQTSRTIAGTAYTQSFDYDNRLTGVAGGSVSTTFLHDTEGNGVKGTVAGVTTVYIAGLYEWQNGAVTKYYEGGAIRRTGYARRERRLLHPERPVALDKRAGQPERYGEQPQLLFPGACHSTASKEREPRWERRLRHTVEGLPLSASCHPPERSNAQP